MALNVLLCGVGGQGTVLASKLIAAAALNRGENVKTAETIGMSQRGGCVVSHVRAGEVVHSPLIPHGEADVIIGFEPGEAVRCLPYLKKGGCVIVNSKAVKPVTASLSGSDYNGIEMTDYIKKTVARTVVIDGDSACEKCGSVKALNVVLLGAAVQTGCLEISTDEISTAILKLVPEKFHQLNIKALSIGADAADKENR